MPDTAGSDPTEPGILILANPVSGSGRGRRWAHRAATRLDREGIPCRIGFTTQEGGVVGPENQSIPPPRAYQGIWVIGGDGTLNFLMNLLDGAPVPVAVFPCGTGNVVARELGVPLSFGGAYAVARSQQVLPIDLGSVDGSSFVFMVSAGIDAMVVHHIDAHRTGPMRRWHYLPAIRAVLAAEQREERCFVELDGVSIGGAAYVAVFNVSRYAGGFRVCPGADMTDGQFDVILLRDPMSPRILQSMHAALRGRLDQLPGGSRHLARRIRIEGAGQFQVDGDPRPGGDVEISIRPGAGLVHVGPKFERPSPRPVVQG